VYCRSCHSKKLRIFFDLGSHIPANFYIKKREKSLNKKLPLKIYFCKKCYLVQIKDYISGKKLFSEDYAYLSGVSKTWHDHCQKFTNYCINKFKLKGNDNILEIASNDGTLLKYFKKKRMNVIGIEPTKSTAKIAIKNNIHTEIKFFNYLSSIWLKQKYKKFSLIVANNVIAHVDDLNDFLKGLNYISDDKTILSIEFQYIANLIKYYQFDTIYHEHFSYYSLLSFENLIKKYNFKIFDIKKIKTHGGSLRVFLCNKENNIPISSNYYTLKKLEKNLGINDEKFYLSFKKKIESQKKIFIRKINQINKKNKIIFAYGAAAKGNTFLNYMKLNSNTIQYIMDKNIYKINKLSPGGLIKILHPDILIDSHPDYILILAWNLKNEIISELRKKYNYKNKFILGIPKFQIIN